MRHRSTITREAPHARPDRRHLRAARSSLRRAVRHRGRRVVVLGEQPAHAARRRCGCPRRRRPPARRRGPVAIALARAEATKNGYTNGAGGVTVDAWQGRREHPPAARDHQRPVNTFFARVLGINSFHGARDSTGRLRAPGPDGQPGELLRRVRQFRHCATATANTVCDTAGGTTVYPPPTTYTGVTTSYVTAASAPHRNLDDPDQYRHVATTLGRRRSPANQYQTFGGFNITLNSSVTKIDGIEVSAEMSKTGTGATCQIQYELSWRQQGHLYDGHRPEARHRT